MIVGTAGHIDHGKTALVRALTGVETDRLAEEQRRGITIDLGFAYHDLAEGMRVGFVDVPGHERFIHTMLAGAAGIDFALLVVAADDGVMPQTREHLAILDLLGLGQGVVALTKIDLVAADRRDAVEREIREVLSGTALARARIVPVSTVTGLGLSDLRARIVEAAGAKAGQENAGAFRLAVDRSFTIGGAGTVVTGTVLSGAVTVGDHVTVSPSGLGARVRQIRAQDRETNHGVAGDRCALNLSGEGVSREVIRRGDMVLDPMLHEPTARVDADLRVLASEARALGQWFPVRLHHGAAEVGARVVLLGDRPIEPGSRAFVQLVLDAPIAAAVGDRFVLRDTTARRTVGGGRFLDLRAPVRRRRTPERLARLAATDPADPGATLGRLVEIAPFHEHLPSFARDWAMEAAPVSALAAGQDFRRVPGGDGAVVMAPDRWRLVAGRVGAELAGFHEREPDLAGLGVERLRLLAAREIPAPLFRLALGDLKAEGLVALDGAWVRLSGHEARLSADNEALWNEAAPLLGGAERFRPPRTRDLAATLAVDELRMRRILKTASRMGRIFEVAHDHFFLAATLREIVSILVAIARDAPRGEFTAADLRDRLENGRKVAIQILEFLDRHGLTLRRDDLRRLNPHRLDLFGPAEPLRTDELGRESSPVGRPDFKSGWGREPVLGGFDSHSPPPSLPDRP